MSSFLVIQQLTKCYGDFTALNHISLTIEKGEFICFLGPSGCGKTTLLRLIAGLENCEQGEIWQNGVNYTHCPPAQRDFGIVFQSYALFPNLTVADNIGFGLKNQGYTKNKVQQAVNKWLATVGLTGSDNKYPNQLSGGQQQRVALARALALSPSLLLLDEPLSALDAKVRIKLRETLHALQKQLGITTIMVTHDQEEAMTMADRIVVMNHGRIEQVGTPQEIYQKPNSRFVAEFVGSMNFIKGRAENGQLYLADQRLARAPATTQNASLTLGIRPEQIQFCHGANQLPVVIESMEFQGAFVRAFCNPLGWDSPSSVKVDIPVSQFAELKLQPGSESQLVIQPQHVHLFHA